jgi:hypothetical protein
VKDWDGITSKLGQLDFFVSVGDCGTMLQDRRVKPTVQVLSLKKKSAILASKTKSPHRNTYKSLAQNQPPAAVLRLPADVFEIVTPQQEHGEGAQEYGYCNGHVKRVAGKGVARVHVECDLRGLYASKYSWKTRLETRELL